MEAGPCSFQMFEIVVQQIYFSMLFEDPFCTKCNLREFVLTQVIMAPGARGRRGPSSGPWQHFGGIRGIREIVPNRANNICFYSNSDSGDTPVQCFFLLFHTLSSKTPSF